MRRIIDICMTVLLLFLMAYQVTGETVHEWTGIGMTVLVIIHQILNRKWYSAVFRGKYNPYRIMTTAVNILLLLSFAFFQPCSAVSQAQDCFSSFGTEWQITCSSGLLLHSWIMKSRECLFYWKTS